MRIFKRRVGQGLGLKSRLSGILQELACWGGASPCASTGCRKPFPSPEDLPLSRILVTFRAWLMAASQARVLPGCTVGAKAPPY